jgi:23S rRNA (uracil1939-C5)-methyltransferase
VGLRRGASARIEALDQCLVLDPRLSVLLAPLNDLLRNLRHADRLHELWLAAGETEVALAFSASPTPHPEDVDALQRFCAARGLDCQIATLKDRRSKPSWPESDPPLCYRILDRRLELRFQPWHFTQANRVVNEMLVHEVLQLLAPGPQDRVLDLFCGLGNFSLPLALHAAHVTGIEGDAAMVGLAQRNAAANGISNAEFVHADLAQDPAAHAWSRQRHELVLLDPPRTGAAALMPSLLRCGARRIAYVSCDVATLARDAAALCARGKYKLEAAGVLDMFPHTAHVEALAIFGK